MRAIRLIDHLALHRAIFAPPASLVPPIILPGSMPLHTAPAASTILHYFLSPPTSSPSLPSAHSGLEPDIPPHATAKLEHLVSLPPSSHLLEQLHTPNPTLLGGLLADPTTKRRLYLASALTPFRHLTFVEKKKTKLVVEACIREGLKVSMFHVSQYLDIINTFFCLAWCPKSLC